MSDEPRLPLWQWILLAVAPGLICDVLGAFRMALGQARDVEAIEMLILLTMLAAPLLGLAYLIVLGRRYVRAGESGSGSVWLFVLGYGFVNVLLWGAGCAMFLSEFKLDFR